MRRTSFALFAISLVLPGCVGYRVGHRSLFRPDIQTVHLPVFESSEYRRFVGERLTESVAKEIELNSPYKVIDSLTADSVLTGRVIGVNKRVRSENALDDPRDLEVAVHVEVTWTDRRGNVLLQRVYSSPASLIPEAGLSMATAQRVAMQKLARDIVSDMQAGW